MTSKIPFRSRVGWQARSRFAVPVLLGFVLGGCGPSPTEQLRDPDPDPEPTTGALTVDIVTTGWDFGEGYILSLDDDPRTVGVDERAAFSDLPAGSHTLELMDQDYNCFIAGQPRRTLLVTAGETAAAQFTIECRTKVIAFVSVGDGPSDIYAGSFSGEGASLFPDLGNSFEDEPAWSPDGTRLAGATDLGGDFDVFTMDLTGNLENLTANPDVPEGMPAWHPSGERIAYRAMVNGNEDIWVMDADGSDQAPLIATPAKERRPRWSPNGESVVYVSDDDGSDDIWVYHIPTETYSNLTSGAAADDWPAWSPNGEFIAFASDRDGDFELYVMRADGSGPVNVSQAPGSNEWAPVFSPDGKYISFTTERAGDLDLYWMRSDGAWVRPMVDGPGHHFSMSWNPVPWSN